MTIGTRLILSLTAPLILLVSVFGYVDQRISREQLRAELQREGRAVARTMQLAMEDALRDRNLEDVKEFADQVSGYERILGIRIFDRAGAPIHASPSLEEFPFRQSEALALALRESRVTEVHRQIGEQPAMSYIVPLKGPGGDLLGALQVLQLESYIEDDARAARRSIIVLTGLMIAATVITVLAVTRTRVGRPVKDLVQRFRAVGSGSPPPRPAERRRDELGWLGEEFERMCEQLDRSRRSLLTEQEERRGVEARLRAADRLASLGRMAAGLAHEVGTPLNVIRGRAEQLIRSEPHEEAAAKNLRIIVDQIERIARIVQGMMDFARAREPRFTSTDVFPVIRRVLEFLAHRFEQSGVRLEACLVEGAPQIVADPDQLHQVFLNLASNALDAMPGGGTLTVRADRVTTARPDLRGAPGEFLAISFQDTGTGIPPADLERVFDPFFTTKEVGKGTGLGLSVSYGIVQDHGGWISAESRTGSGACFTVHLPLDGSAVAPGSPPASERAA